MTNILLGIMIGGTLVLTVGYKLKNRTNQKISELTNKNKKLLEENLSLKTVNTQNKIFIDKIIDRVKMLEERGDQLHTWFGSLLRHNPEQPFSKEIIEKLIAENKIFDDT